MCAPNCARSRLIPAHEGHKYTAAAKLRGRQPRLKPAQDREIRRMHDSRDYNVAGIGGLFSVSRPTVYRSLERTAELPPLPAGTWPRGAARPGLICGSHRPGLFMSCC
jgi:hypothetical protein